eukprot:1996813-Amphidinium_carterae.1
MMISLGNASLCSMFAHLVVNAARFLWKSTLNTLTFIGCPTCTMMLRKCKLPCPLPQLRSLTLTQLFCRVHVQDPRLQTVWPGLQPLAFLQRAIWAAVHADSLGHAASTSASTRLTTS